MLTLIGVAIVVIGFVLRMNPLLVVTVAGLATGIASGLGPLAVVAAFGKAFITSRYVAIVWLVLPVVGLLEPAGLEGTARPRRRLRPACGYCVARSARLLRDPPNHRRARPHITGRARADGPSAD